MKAYSNNRMSDNSEYKVRNAKPSEFEEIGKLLVEVYAQLEGFPKPSEQPEYYEKLANISDFINKPGAELLVALSPEDKILGAVVFFSDIKYYGSGGSATREKNAAGFRLLGVSPQARGKGIGKLLTVSCMDKARENHAGQLIIHTTMAMQTAWKMYEHFGFKRSEDLDFMQGALPVYGFRLLL